MCVTCSNYYIPSREAGQSVQTYFSLPLAPPTGNKEKYGWLARLDQTLEASPLEAEKQILGVPSLEECVRVHNVDLKNCDGHMTSLSQ